MFFCSERSAAEVGYAATAGLLRLRHPSKGQATSLLPWLVQ